MRRSIRLAWDGMRTRKLAFAILCAEMLAASLVISQALFLVRDLAAAKSRVAGFQPFDQWYQLSDASSAERFAARSSSADFEQRLGRLYAWLQKRDGIDLVVLPKSQVMLGDGQAAIAAYVVSPNVSRYFDIRLADGAWFDEADAKRGTPVVIGHALADRYHVGDTLPGGCSVCGVLAPGARVYDLGFGMNPIDMDRMVLVPSSVEASDAGSLDAILNSPIVRFRTESAQHEFEQVVRRLDVYDYAFLRLDDWLARYSRYVLEQIALEGAIVAAVLLYALSAFVFTVLRSLASRRREFGVHLAYGASHADFWLAVGLELLAASCAGGALPLLVFRPPWWWAVVAGFCVTAALLAVIPARALKRRTIPELMRGLT